MRIGFSIRLATMAGKRSPCPTATTATGERHGTAARCTCRVRATGNGNTLSSTARCWWRRPGSTAAWRAGTLAASPGSASTSRTCSIQATTPWWCASTMRPMAPSRRWQATIRWAADYIAMFVLSRPAMSISTCLTMVAPASTSSLTPSRATGHRWPGPRGCETTVAMPCAQWSPHACAMLRKGLLPLRARQSCCRPTVRRKSTCKRRYPRRGFGKACRSLPVYL